MKIKVNLMKIEKLIDKKEINEKKLKFYRK